jgi:glycosyltransferase involved in cell wall biosynthesis
MKILVLTQYFWPEAFRINDVAKSMAQGGHTVEILTGKPNYPEGVIFEGYRAWGCQKELWNDIQIYRIPIFARGKKGATGLALNYLSFVVSGLLFAPWVLRGNKYDAIFVYAPSPILQTIPALFLGWIKKVPVTLWVQDLWPESLSATGYVMNSQILKAVKYVVSFIYRHVDLLLVPSEAFIQPVRDLASGAPVEYYPNSVDESFSRLSKAKIPEIPGLNSGFSVMFTGNIGSAQAVETIIEAAEILKEKRDIHFIILGDGSRREWMMQEADQRGLVNLHLPGRFPVESMPAFMQKADVLLVTLTDQPIFALTVPNKVQAYLAAGRPIIACLNGEGARLVVEAGAGLPVPAQDGKALAEAVLKLHDMTEEMRENLGHSGRAYFRTHFDHDLLIDKLIERLRMVAEKGKGIQ